MKLVILMLLIIIGAALSAPAVTAQPTDILILPLPTTNNSIPTESSDDTTICCHQFPR
jgi:hypothetical protein